MPILLQNVTMNVVTLSHGGADQVIAPRGLCTGGHNPRGAPRAQLRNVRSFKSFRFATRSRFTIDFKYPESQKIYGVRSRDRGSLAIQKYLFILLSSAKFCRKNCCNQFFYHPYYCTRCQITFSFTHFFHTLNSRKAAAEFQLYTQKSFTIKVGSGKLSGISYIANGRNDCLLILLMIATPFATQTPQLHMLVAITLYYLFYCTNIFFPFSNSKCPIFVSFGLFLQLQAISKRDTYFISTRYTDKLL